MPNRKRGILAGVFIAGALGAWLGYLWFVSGVITNKEKYPNGSIKAEGYLKRTGWSTYERHGRWITHHPDGRLESDGTYENGKKAGLWRHWSAEGRESRIQHGPSGTEPVETTMPSTSRQ